MKRGILAFLVVSLIVPILPMPSVRAASSGVVIQSVQAAGASASHEVVELRNNGTNPVDVTGWSLVYASASGATTTTIVKLNPPDYSTRVFLDGETNETLVSSEYAVAFIANRTGLITFSAGMNHLGGALILRDAQGETIDMVGWGTATKNIENTVAVALKTTTYLRRTGLDSDDNSKDFVAMNQSDTRTLTFGRLRESIDVCANLEGMQEDRPAGMIQNEGVCEYPFVPARLTLSELLANPNGSDAGHEFIEILNYEVTEVSLADYMLRLNGKTYGFPDGATIKAGEYQVWSDDDLGVVFANTSGSVIELLARDQVIDTMPVYKNAPIDTSWAWFDDGWHYTNQLTPNAQNITSREITLEESDDGAVVINQGCKEGYYRNELTNRCRKMPTSYQLSPCKEGQYRSEETGRCRSIVQTVAASLKPCADDQFRNPSTGRCKKIASTDDILAPCKEGYTRNPETNRCRKEILSTMPTAGFPVEPIKQVAGNAAMWWTLGGIGIATVGYASWEWRSEISRILRRVLGVISFGRH